MELWPCGQMLGWAEARVDIPSREGWHILTLEPGMW